jgi:cobalt-zinc-cadmium efflux system outer membrane protein
VEFEMRARQTIEAGTLRRNRPAALLLVLVAALRRGPLLAQDRAAADTHSPSAAAGDAGAAAAPGGFISDPSSLASWLAAHNQEVISAGARVRQAEAAVAQAHLVPNPTLSASAGDYAVGETNPPGLAYADTAIYTTALGETVEIGKRGPRIAAAESRLEAERQNFADTLARVSVEARAGLARVVYLRARLAFLEESLLAGKQIETLQQSRLDNGDISGSDFDRLLVDTSLLESDVARTRADTGEAMAVCHAVLYAPCDAPGPDLAGIVATTEVPAVPDVESALATRPDLRSLDLQAEASRDDALLGRRRRVPDPTLSLTYVHDNLVVSGDQPKTLALGVGFALPVFDRGQHEFERAGAAAAELDAAARDARTRARAELTALQERRSFLDQTLHDLQEQAVPRAKGVLDATVSAVGQGGLSTTDLLLARRTYTDLLLRVIDFEFDAFNVRNDLRRGLGLDAAVARSLLPAPPGTTGGTEP